MLLLHDKETGDKLQPDGQQGMKADFNVNVMSDPLSSSTKLDVASFL